MIKPGHVVALVSNKTSKVGGQTKKLSAIAVGRVCKKYPSGFCCVRIAGGCFRIHESSLKRADGPAPDCTAPCSASC